MSKLIQSSLPCPKCDGQRSYAIYDDNEHCFRCWYHKHKEFDINLYPEEPVKRLKWTGGLPSDFSRKHIPNKYKEFINIYFTDDEKYHTLYGYSAELDRLVFPIFYENNRENDLMCYQARALEREPKWLTCSPEYNWGKKFPFINIIDSTKPIVIVEDVISAIRISLLSFNVISTLGCTPSLALVNFITNYSNNFIIWYDGDDAGKEGTKNLFDILKLCAKVNIITTTKDPKAYKRVEIRRILEN